MRALSRLAYSRRSYLGANVGDALAPLAAGALLVWLSWRGTASVSALPVFALAAWIAFALTPRDRQGQRRDAAGSGLAEYWQDVKGLVGDRLILHLSLLAGFRTMAQMGLLVFLPLYLADVAGMGPFMMGVTVMALQVGGIFASPIAGAWSDRAGRRPVVLAGLSVSTVLIAVLTVIQNDVLFIAGVSVLGFVMYAARPVIHSWMMDGGGVQKGNLHIFSCTEGNIRNPGVQILLKLRRHCEERSDEATF